MPSVKRALGRGLADLIPVGGAEAGEKTGSAAQPRTQEAALASLHPNPRQPRTQFDDIALAELAESVKANGVLQPILVRPRAAGGFEIVAGERRYRAALRAGLAQVPVVVRSLSDEETLALALVENLLREDIGPLEAARAFRRLMDDFGWTQEQLAQRVGKSRAAVTNALRLLRLPPPIQESLERGEITEGHARALLSGEPAPPARQREVWQLIRARGISVREAERLMKTEPAARAPAAPRAPLRSPGLSALEDRLRRALGTKVRIDGDEEKGRIEIAYYSGEELDGLLAHIEGGQPAPAARAAGNVPGLLSSRRPA